MNKAKYIARLMKHTRLPIEPDGCWEWVAAKRGIGYGTTYFEQKVTPAHRVAFMLFCGPIPEDMWVLHRCDNPSCIRPDHLYLGTPKQNSLDRDSRGRGTKGKQRINRDNIYRGPRPWTWNAKLTAEKVLEIRELHATEHVTMHDLGDMYNINPTTVWSIIHRKIWKHI